MPNQKLYVECINCWIWGEVPEGTKENKHFIHCPKCDGKMFVSRSSPLEAGQTEKNKMIITKLSIIPKDYGLKR